MPKKVNKVSVKKALVSLRSSRKSKHLADVVLVIRGSVDEFGDWNVEWEAANWIRDENVIGASGLPSGFPVAAGRELIEIGATESAEKSLGKFGTALGKSFLETVASGGIEAIRKGYRG